MKSACALRISASTSFVFSVTVAVIWSLLTSQEGEW